MREWEQEKMDDEWEELDESAMEECMSLATQMCSKLPQDEDTFKQRNNQTPKTTENKFFKSRTPKDLPNTKDQPMKTTRHIESFDNNAAIGFDDSGFSSVKSNSVNNSRLLISKTKSVKAACNQTSNFPKPSYIDRFSDFSVPSSNSRKSFVGHGKPVRSSGKVYNSIPMKGTGGTLIAAKTCIQPTCSSGSEGNQQELLRKIQAEKIKLEEDAVLKQGEIALLRAEMKRKEAALETERLEHCASIEAAEKRGKLKVANAAAEAEAKAKESARNVEKLQGELLFKNREVEELINRCRQLEQQMLQHTASKTHGTPMKRYRSEIISPKASPGTAHSSFASRFDFGGGRSSVRSVEIQTESSYSKAKVRRRLNVTVARGEVCGSRRSAYLLSASGSAPVVERQAVITSCAGKNWSLPCEWSYLISQIITEKERVCVEKRLMSLAIERLQEVHTLIVSKEAENNRWPVTSSSPVDWYEVQVIPALHVISSFASPHNLNHEPKALQIISAHLSPLHIKEVLVNNRICFVILDTMEKVASFVSSPKDKVVCEQVIVSLRDCFANIDTSSEVLPVLKALVALASHTTLTSFMCTSAGSCLVGKLCSTINKLCIGEVTTVSLLLKWIMVLMKEPPQWLNSNCVCPSQLLAALLKHICQTLDYTDTEKGSEKKLYRLLLSCIRVLHCWSIVDPEWWEKVAQLPHYTAFMSTVITNAKDIQPDRQTVDLLCDLYEVDEGMFDGY